MTGENYAPLFKTERFDIFHQRVVRNPELGLPRDVYSAWFHNDDIPKPICVVTVWKDNPYFPNYVEWVEVCDDWRRNGVATEVLRGLRLYLGQLTMDSGSPTGEAFLAAKREEINA